MRVGHGRMVPLDTTIVLTQPCLPTVASAVACEWAATPSSSTADGARAIVCFHVLLDAGDDVPRLKAPTKGEAKTIPPTPFNRSKDSAHHCDCSAKRLLSPVLPTSKTIHHLHLLEGPLLDLRRFHQLVS